MASLNSIAARQTSHFIEVFVIFIILG